MGRYSNLWIRQAALGRGTSGATNYATVGLFNSSSGANYIVVRDWQIDANSASEPFNFFLTQTRLSGALGAVTMMDPTQGSPAGVVDTSDQASATTKAFYVVQCQYTGVARWHHDFPFVVVPPGWELGVQDQFTGKTDTVSFMWEEVLADQLESFYESLIEH